MLAIMTSVSLRVAQNEGYITSSADRTGLVTLKPKWMPPTISTCSAQTHSDAVLSLRCKGPKLAVSQDVNCSTTKRAELGMEKMAYSPP